MSRRRYAPIFALGFTLSCGPVPDALGVKPGKGSREGGADVELIGCLGWDEAGNAVPVVGHGPLSLYFGERSALGVVIEGDFLIRAVTPKREEPGLVDVQLHFDDGVHYTIERGFEYDVNAGIVLRPDIAR